MQSQTAEMPFADTMTLVCYYFTCLLLWLHPSWKLKLNLLESHWQSAHCISANSTMNYIITAQHKNSWSVLSVSDRWCITVKICMWKGSLSGESVHHLWRQRSRLNICFWEVTFWIMQGCKSLWHTKGVVLAHSILLSICNRFTGTWCICLSWTKCRRCRHVL